jgi:glycosyltransferase involved in cell wall biosynthesis
MRLAQFIQRYPPARGGSEAYVRRLSRHCADAGDAVTVWTTTALDLTAFWSPAGRCRPAGIEDDGPVRVRRYPLWRMRGRRWLLKPLSMIPAAAWQAMTLPCNPVSLPMWRDAGRPADRYDAVHAAAFPYAWPLMCARRLARKLDVPFLLTPFLHVGDANAPHDRTRRQYTQPALRQLLRSADRVFVQTEVERGAVLELGVGADRVILQGLGVDPKECTGGDRQPARQAWGVSNDTVVIGHLANLSVEKGSMDLLAAAESLPRCKVVLAGPAMPNFQPRGPAVILGELTDGQKRDFFAGIDVFALPSRSDSFGLVLLEAWANGVPVVAYRAGGPGELVRHGEDGLLARCGDVDGLAGCLIRLTARPQERQAMGAAGRARLASEFAWRDKLELVRRTADEAARRHDGFSAAAA